MLERGEPMFAQKKRIQRFVIQCLSLQRQANAVECVQLLLERRAVHQAKGTCTGKPVHLMQSFSVMRQQNSIAAVVAAYESCLGWPSW